MQNLIKFLRSNEAVLLALIFALLTQLSHSIIAYASLAKEKALWFNYLFGVMFSLALSLSILLFTLRGRKRLAVFYLLVEMFINIIYYRLYELENTYVLFSTIFLALIIPVTIFSYSHEVFTDETVLEKEITMEIGDKIGEREYKVKLK